MRRSRGAGLRCSLARQPAERRPRLNPNGLARSRRPTEAHPLDWLACRGPRPAGGHRPTCAHATKRNGNSAQVPHVMRGARGEGVGQAGARAACTRDTYFAVRYLVPIPPVGCTQWCRVRRPAGAGVIRTRDRQDRTGPDGSVRSSIRKRSKDTQFRFNVK